MTTMDGGIFEDTNHHICNEEKALSPISLFSYEEKVSSPQINSRMMNPLCVLPMSSSLPFPKEIPVQKETKPTIPKKKFVILNADDIPPPESSSPILSTPVNPPYAPPPMNTFQSSQYYYPLQTQTPFLSIKSDSSLSSIPTSSSIPTELPYVNVGSGIPEGSRKRVRSDSTSNKKGKKHYQGSIDEDLERAIQSMDPQCTGVSLYWSGPKRSFVVLCEDKFYEWIKTQRPGFTIEKESLYEKFNKSRPTNRVNSKEKSGHVAIKFLRIDTNPQEFGPNVINHMNQIRDNANPFYSGAKIRVYTHRDWGYISEQLFYYDIKSKN